MDELFNLIVTETETAHHEWIWQLDKDLKPTFKKLCELVSTDAFILSGLGPKYNAIELDKIAESIDDMF